MRSRNALWLLPSFLQECLVVLGYCLLVVVTKFQNLGSLQQSLFSSMLCRPVFGNICDEFRGISLAFVNFAVFR